MTITIQYRFINEITLHEYGEGGYLTSLVDGKTVKLDAMGLRIASSLKSNWLTGDDAASLAEDLSRGYFTLTMLQRAGMLDARAVRENVPLFSVSPCPEESAFRGKLGLGAPQRLNRFGYLRRRDDRLFLESPLTPCRVSILDCKLVGLMHGLCSGLRMDIAGEDVACFLSALKAMGFVEDAWEKGDDPSMEFWEFHDLLFCSRTLNGGHAYSLGGTYRFQGKRHSLPVVREPLSDQTVPLPELSAPLTERLEQPFSSVLGNRKSLRDFGGGAMTLGELGAFLYASARICCMHDDLSHDDVISKRPTPSGGARHPIEIYLFVRNCEELEVGAYHYDPMHHLLEVVPLSPEGLEVLNEDNPLGFMSGEPPQVQLYLSARIERTAWKYESIAYKIINQDMGCLFQTFYLVATALGLAPCALGSLDTRMLGKVMGLDWKHEPFIGSFILGK